METNKAYIKYIASLLLFGLNGIVASYIALSSYEIVFTRTLIGSLLLVLIFIASRQKIHLTDSRTHAVYLLISGIAMGASWMFLYEAYRQVGVSIATLAYYCGPVIVMILSPILFREKITWAKAFGFFIVLIGMFCVNTQALSEGKTTWGILCGGMSAVMYAFMVICNKKAKSITGLENSMWQLIISCVTATIFLGMKQGLTINIEASSMIPILILGIVNTGIGCYFYFSSIGDLPVQTVAICGYLEPLSAVLFSVFLLHETMDVVQLLGAVLIFGGAVFGEFFCRSGLTPEEL
ncbi:DMT family transporter [Clostridium aminobutyricum]|uniref:EamA family transporter n=1 Tax=Clostridium aminobutyricum TaxID=33953 RepID=A0A939D711_CLOAM|nr:DMT family transporter [Clostridium aminobutyricum]MBN7772290.1 EamA family transporter [Clostridium aminobutyricum]